MVQLVVKALLARSPAYVWRVLRVAFSPSLILRKLALVSLLQRHIPADRVLMDAGELLIELTRDASVAETQAMAHYYPSVALCEQARAVEIITDA